MDYRERYGPRPRHEGAFRRRRGDERRAYDRREAGRRADDDRGFIERVADELRSWFQEEEAPRAGDEREGAPGRWGGGDRGWGARGDDEVDRDWARQWGYVDRGGRRERLERWSEPPRYVGSSWTRAGGYGGEGYGSERHAVERGDEPRWGWGDPSAWGAEPRWTAESPGAAGPHAGRGPRNYRRPDERIREDVCDVLCDHGWVDASEIDVTVQTGEVTLSGVVRERQQKRMAEEAVEQVTGVRDVHNQLRVSPGGSDQEPRERPGDPHFRAA
jgi:hypothetical protein